MDSRESVVRILAFQETIDGALLEQSLRMRIARFVRLCFHTILNRTGKNRP
jgi:hypothetical protein